jgi:hypothetical protein
VQDNSPFLSGDALNPATWTIQRLDTNAYFSVVGVAQTSTYEYTLTTLEEFGAVSVNHRVSTSTLKDTSGSIIATPRQADFLGILDAQKATPAARLAAARVAAQDIANTQVPDSVYFGGTLEIGPDGDYKTDTGAKLVRKLLYRRMVSNRGDFFHLPNYGEGLRVKELIAVADLPRKKALLEKASLSEPEVDGAVVTLTLDTKNQLNVKLKVKLKSTGEAVDVDLNPPAREGVQL